MLNFMDKNEHNIKIHAQDKDCVYQRSSDVSIFFREHVFNIIENITVIALTYIYIYLYIYIYNKGLFPENTHDSLQNNNIEAIDNVNTYDAVTNDTIENNNVLIADMNAFSCKFLSLNAIFNIVYGISYCLYYLTLIAR